MMETIYRDDRFPGLEIRNLGRVTFNVYRDGAEVDVFTVYQGDGYTIDPTFAAKCAQDHFDEMAQPL